ncbi:hypothetical protein LMG26696_02704 [Achromobacter pulmonis]|nr:hypothetical protein LMG26696_02704 [Achromobacter pulmonis]
MPPHWPPRPWRCGRPPPPPGYGVVDLMGYWRPASVKGLQVQAGVFNLFDKKYWEAINVPTAGATALPRPVDEYTEPGRSLRVSLTYQY